MADQNRISSAYAKAFFDIAVAEGNLGDVEDELFRFGRIFESNDELRTALTDEQVPAPRRQQMVEELLGGRATTTTTSIVSYIVASGRVRELPAIIKEMVESGAGAQGKAVAEVRSAVELTDDQQTRLAAALQQAIGRPVEIKVIIDPSVLGGLTTQIGDTVIDGTVRSKLVKLRESFN